MYEPGWAIGSDLADYIVERFAKRRFRTVVEFGSGDSTILFAKLIPEWGTVTAYEQSPAYAEQVRELVADWKNVTVCQHDIEDGWYKDIDVPPMIDFVLVDGPGPCKNRTREPAMDAVYPNLVNGGVVVVDDGFRAESQAAVQGWMDRYPDLYVRFLDHERGTYVLVKQP